MKKLSIIIPVWNEKDTIEELLRCVLLASVPGYEKEIVVIDDGSNDGTTALLDSLRKVLPFELVRHVSHQGKGAALKSGLQRANGELILTQDADLEYSPADYERLLEALTDKTPVVYGSRVLGQSRPRYPFYAFGALFLTKILNLLWGSALTDMYTGYKLFRTDIIKTMLISSDGFEFCPEVTSKILKAGYIIREIPIGYSPRTFAEGKKVRVWDGVVGLFTLLTYRFI